MTATPATHVDRHGIALQEQEVTAVGKEVRPAFPRTVTPDARRQRPIGTHHQIGRDAWAGRRRRDTRCRPGTRSVRSSGASLVAAVEKRMTPARFQVPLSGAVTAQSTRTGPPPDATALSWPSVVKKPISRLSGDQKGAKARSVPGSTRGATSESRERIHSRPPRPRADRERDVLPIRRNRRERVQWHASGTIVRCGDRELQHGSLGRRCPVGGQATAARPRHRHSGDRPASRSRRLRRGR